MQVLHVFDVSLRVPQYSKRWGIVRKCDMFAIKRLKNGGSTRVRANLPRPRPSRFVVVSAILRTRRISKNGLRIPEPTSSLTAATTRYTSHAFGSLQLHSPRTRQSIDVAEVHRQFGVVAPSADTPQSGMIRCSERVALAPVTQDGKQLTPIAATRCERRVFPFASRIIGLTIAALQPRPTPASRGECSIGLADVSG